MKGFNLSTVWLVPRVSVLYVFSTSTLCGDPSWLQVCTGQWKRPSQSFSSKWSLWFRRCIDQSTSSPCLLILNIHFKSFSKDKRTATSWPAKGSPRDTTNYYSFKIFPRFCLAKSRRLIHHNQLLMTKFGRILSLTRKWRQKCSLLQVNAPLTEKTWGRGWVVLVVNICGHFTRFKSKN